MVITASAKWTEVNFKFLVIDGILPDPSAKSNR